ncbi:YolD-like family protein [Paenibacillus sp. SYP-B3998]|uniref:YolD-like family protein n=1 Tax=Paenibacillus sp. SYP-B3998 TaxID=2678564 RepID=A0A6G3ZWZ8_9BACL|nr:YolD-like family protein [Paenibacillus sp. SYP-B3998]NEW06746.1 YolD-like family protein [Paenibacillus sp. SYP-B3998]
MAKAKVAKRPTRDEFVLEEIGNQLTEAKQEGSEIVLTVWGVADPVRGLIVGMDSRTGKVHVERNGETVKIPFMDIMQVNYPKD